ncbi:MAG TPA: response regulator [Synergistaceae bacterium]|jgi:response regulator of citrate/malate metabolism|nr:response regulator [Synergistaceae bacterium]HPQ37313.1 response regulator [Synergistaceae bacterium]
MTLYLGILDDDPAILYTIEAMGESQGWDVRTTTDPEEAFLWITRQEVDILLVDYHMPQCNGSEFVRRSREASPAVVLLALTVEERPEIAREMLTAGADDFISKPLRLADFSSRIALHRELARMRRDIHRGDARKGIATETLRGVLQTLDSLGGHGTAREVADTLGVSYPTAHRYLEHLVSSSLVVRSTLYRDGQPGRPRSEYALLQGEKEIPSS